jgi:glycosyltransferase involved in cell wall biosynthesis
VKVALVGPLERSNTGVGTYNSLVIPVLEKKCDLHFFEDCTSIGDGEAAPDRAFALVDAVKSQDFDHVVFTLGNSIHHYQTYVLAKYLQGHCWFHDSNLAGMHLAYAAGFSEISERVKYIRNVIYENYGPYRNFSLSVSDILSFNTLNQERIFLTRDLTRSARSVIVSTQAGQDMIEADFHLGLPSAILQLPLGIKDHGIRGNDKRWDKKDLVSIGRLDRSKRPDEIIDLFLSLSTELGCLSFVGKMDDLEFVDELQRGIPIQYRDRIHFRNGLARKEYLDEISKAFCAIQLRTQNQGEMSGAITDALSVGTPCVTNLRGAVEYQGVSVARTAEELHSQLRGLVENFHSWKIRVDEAVGSVAAFSLEHTASQLLDWLDAR